MESGESASTGLHQNPRQPGDLTAEWLTGALQSAGFDGVVSSFDIRLLGEGVGMMSVLCLIDLQYGAGTGPGTVVGKFAATVAANLAVALHFDLYRREVVFYRDIAPLTKMCVPRVYFADVIGSDDFVILMEDMSDYRRGDQIAGCTPEEAATCMDELATLHAPFWDKVDTPTFAFTFVHAPSLHSIGMCQATIDGWDSMIATFGPYVPGFIQDVKDRYLAVIPKMQLWLAQDPITFVHGDFRLDNLLFGDAPGQASVVTLDWQGVLRSKGIQDVAYLLSQSMEPTDRARHEQALVALWHRGLVDAGVTGYAAEQAWQDYRRAVLSLWVYVTVIASALDPSNDRGKQFMSGMITRAASAISDLDCLSLLTDFE